MARCQDCNKFVSLDTGGDPDFSIDNVEIHEPAAGNTPAELTGTVTMYLSCSECGMELKSISLDANIGLSLPTEPPNGGEWEPDSEWDVSDESADSVEERVVEYPGKRGRTKKVTEYGSEVTVTMSRPIKGNGTYDVQASTWVGAPSGDWEDC